MKNDPILLTLGKNVSDLRKEKGLTPEQIVGMETELSSSVIENCVQCCCEIESNTVWAVCPFCGEINICCHACMEWINETADNCYRYFNGAYFIEGQH
jgi:hypothetical protein